MNIHRILILVILLCHWNLWAEVTAAFDHNPAYLREPIILRVYDVADMDRDPATAVDGVKWLDPAGEVSGNDVLLTLMPTKVGTIDLGEMSFRGRNNRIVTVKIPKLSVIHHGIFDDDVVLEFRSPLAKVRVGQATPIVIRLLADCNLLIPEDDHRLPSVKVVDSVWRYHATNSNDRRFHVARRRVKLGARTYDTWQFDGLLFPQRSGMLDGTATIPVRILLTPKKASNPFREDVFPSHRRTIVLERRVSLSAIRVSEVPSPPDGVNDLGLIGDLTTTVSTTPESIPLDGDVKLRFTARGTGNFEQCRPTVLSPRGWQCFNPQKRVDLKAGTITIEWVLQPTGHTYPLMDLAFAHYSPAQNQWVVTTLNKPVTVEGGMGSDKPPLPLVQHDGMPFTPASSITTLAPPWLVGPLLTLAVLTFLTWRKPLRIRRFERRRRKLVNLLSHATDDQLADAMSGDLLIALRELCDASPGSPLHEFRDRLGNDKFADLVEESLKKSYEQGTAGETASTLVSALKRFRPSTIVLFLLITLTVSAERPEDAYARFDFVEAAHGFEARLESSPTTSTMLNLGHCRFLNQDFPGAMLCAERCLRANPRQPLALDLNRQCREKLGMSTTRELSPMMPTEIIVGGALIWTCGWFLLILGLLTKSRRLKGWALSCIVLGGLSGALAAWRRHTAWDSSRMLVVQEVSLRTIPAADETGDVRTVAGTIVILLGERDGWARVRMGKHAGWIPRSAVGRLVLEPNTTSFTTY